MGFAGDDGVGLRSGLSSGIEGALPGGVPDDEFRGMEPLMYGAVREVLTVHEPCAMKTNKSEQ